MQIRDCDNNKIYNLDSLIDVLIKDCYKILKENGIINKNTVIIKQKLKHLFKDVKKEICFYYSEENLNIDKMLFFEPLNHELKKIHNFEDLDLTLDLLNFNAIYSY